MYRLHLLPMLLALATLVGGHRAEAQDYGDPSGKTLIAAGDLRVVGADGERSWIDGGFGKTRYGGGADEDFRVRPYLAEATLAWSPHISWSLDGLLSVVAQQGQEHPVDVSEGYLTWRRAPHGALRLSARAGLFWPPISPEHTGPDWRVAETITPSAINSWVGEEVKVGGAEATGRLPLAGGHVSLTGALFGFNDTAGTLLAFRGWALHDEKATAFGTQPLPPLDAFMQYAQAARTRPVIELDDRPGWYARLGWSDRTLQLHAFYYDNRGDPQAVNPDLQWGWRTRLGELGASALLGPVRLTAQAITGRTQMGYPMGGVIWVDTSFRSAFLLATHAIGTGSVSGRVEAFGTTGRGSVVARTRARPAGPRRSPAAGRSATTSPRSPNCSTSRATAPPACARASPRSRTRRSSSSRSGCGRDCYRPTQSATCAATWFAAALRPGPAPAASTLATGTRASNRCLAMPPPVARSRDAS